MVLQRLTSDEPIILICETFNHNVVIMQLRVFNSTSQCGVIGRRDKPSPPAAARVAGDRRTN